jgi:hypothetical protein
MSEPDAKARLLAEVGPDLRAALERVPGHLIETATAIATGDERADVLAALCDLLAANTARETRRADAAQAQLAELRRHGLRLAPDLPATSTTTKETA